MKTIGSLFIVLLTSVAFAGTGTVLEGIVKDPSGKPISGADVRIQANGKSVTVKTDAKGHYIATGLAADTYKVSLAVNGAVKAQIMNAATRKDKATTLNFDLKQGPAPKRHMVFVPQETGTHIGGGRWVTVDDNGNVIDDNSQVSTMNSATAKQMQTMRSIQRPGGQ